MEMGGKQDCKTQAVGTTGSILSNEKCLELCFKGMNLPVACSIDFGGHSEGRTKR